MLKAHSLLMERVVAVVHMCLKQSVPADLDKWVICALSFLWK